MKITHQKSKNIVVLPIIFHYKSLREKTKKKFARELYEDKFYDSKLFLNIILPQFPSNLNKSFRESLKMKKIEKMFYSVESY